VSADTKRYLASQFAAKAGVTVRTLHHYDRLGLLRPSARSAAGYRLYGERDLERLQQIVTLKFIGLPLERIRELLDRSPLGLKDRLRLQREALEEKRRRTDLAVRAILEAERVVASGDDGWEAFAKIIEVIEMQKNMDWVKKYYTEEQLAELAERGTPEVLEKGQRDWSELIAEVEAAVAAGEDPAGEHGRSLAARWDGLVGQFTGGDPGIAEGLKTLWSDKANWPTTFKKPYSDEAEAFIAKARASAK
jgi:DNA-binding transcriptional MerR regulator